MTLKGSFEDFYRVIPLRVFKGSCYGLCKNYKDSFTGSFKGSLRHPFRLLKGSFHEFL